MNELPQDCDGEIVTLFCAKLNLEIEFRLTKGSFARIGSSEEMEIAVPILGVDAQAVRLDRDVSGNLIATYGQSTHLAVAGTGIRVGPGHFALAGSRHLTSGEDWERMEVNPPVSRRASLILTGCD